MFDVSLMRVVLCALALALGSATALAQKSGATDPERIAAAKDLMDATGVTKQMDGMIAAMGQGFRTGMQDQAGAAVADAASKEFDRFMERFKSYRPQMMDDFAALYAERFTAGELKTIADFYRAGPGAKFIQAMPELMQVGSQIGIKYGQKAVQDAKNDLKAQ